MLLSHITRRSNPLPRPPDRQSDQYFSRSGGSERILAMSIRPRGCLTVRATRTAGLGASTERLVDNGLDGARASATLGAAPETTINLLGIARKLLSGTDGAADIVVAEDIAGTDNHENGRTLW